jgi:alpha-beta hydrolase superfamily lysophospholipase
MTTKDGPRRAGSALDRALLAVVALLAAFSLYASLRTAEQAVSYRGRPEGPTPADSGLAFDDVPLRSRDGTRLSGWWIRPGDEARRRDLAVVVLAHTTGATRASLLPEATALARAGFIVLALDLRAHGASDGRMTTGGFLETEDVAAAVGLAHERALGAPVVLFGEGSGAIAVLRCAMRDPTIRGTGERDTPLTYGAALFRRPEVRDDPFRWIAIPPLVRARMASLVGRGFRPDAKILNDRWSALQGRPAARFDDRGFTQWMSGRVQNDATHLSIVEWFESVLEDGAVAP